MEKNEGDNIVSLNRETEILSLIKGVKGNYYIFNIKGVPKLVWFGFEHGYNCMALQLLGHDLAHFLKIYKTFSLKCVCNIAD